MSLPSSMADFVPCDRLLQKACLSLKILSRIGGLSLYCKPANISFWSQLSQVQKMDNAIHRINHCPLDSAIGFADLSTG